MAETIQRSFTGGEISPSLQSRADISKYTTGLAKCDNFIVRAQGSAVNRPGFEHVTEILKESEPGVKLVPFEFNSDDTYMLVFADLVMYVIKNGELIHTTTNVNISAEDLAEMSYVQSGDVIFISLGTTISRLERYADDNWDLVSFYEDLPPAPQPSTLTAPSAGSGEGDFDKTYSYVVTFIDGNGVESEPNEVVSIETKSLSTTAGIAVTLGVSSSVVTEYGFQNFRVYKSTDGSISQPSEGPFYWISDVKAQHPTSALAIFYDYNYAPDVTQSATLESHITDITIEGWSTIGCRAMAFYQQRLLIGNLGWFNDRETDPFTLLASRTGKYNRFEYHTPSRDDDAISMTVASRKVDAIRHIVDMNGLFVFTEGAIHSITDGQDQVLTPSTIGSKIASYSGSSKVPPVVLNDSIVYLQNKGNRLRDFVPSQDVTSGVDLSIMADHLFRGHSIKAMAYAEEPYGIIWCLRDDNVLLGLTYQKEHQVWAWHQHHYSNDQEILDIQTVREEGIDSLYAVVYRRDTEFDYDSKPDEYALYDVVRMNTRTVDNILSTDINEYTNAEERLEYMKNFTFLDSYSVMKVTDFNDNGDLIIYMPSLQFETVSIVHSMGVVVNNATPKDMNTLEDIDENNQPGNTRSILPADTFTVYNDGDGDYAVVVVGLPYTSTIETLALDSSAMQETLKTKTMSINEVTIETLNTRGGSIGSLNYTGELIGDMQKITPRYDSDNYNAIQLKSYKESVTLSNGWDEGGKVRIQQTEPLPMTITSIIPELDISG